MISPAAIIAFAVNILICVGLPILLLILICRRQKKHGRGIGGMLASAGMGAAVFFVFQICLRIPLLNLLGGTISDFLQSVWLYSLFLGLTAGLFEELGRLAGFHIIKRQRFWESGVAFGIGHGGIEAILLVGMTNVNNLLFALLMQSGSFDSMASLLGLTPDSAAALTAQFSSLAPMEILLGGVERIFAIAIQIALSLIVLLAVRKKNILLLILSILLHTVVDSPLGLMQSAGWSIWQIESYIALLAIVSAWFIFFSRRYFKEDAVPLPKPPAAVQQEEPGTV